MIRGTGRVLVGDGCRFDGASGKPNVISVLSPGAVVEIGGGSYLNGASILASDRVEVGEGCVLGGCTITDSDFHPLDADSRLAGVPGKVAPVTIGNRCWIGTDVVVLKGVVVGDEAVAGAGTILRRPVPARNC